MKKTNSRKRIEVAYGWSDKVSTKEKTDTGELHP